MDTRDTRTLHAQLATGSGVVRLAERLREPRITLSQRETAQFLVRAAREMQVTECTLYGCEVCEGFVAVWREVYSALTPKTQEAVLEACDLMGQRWLPMFAGVE